MWPRRFENMQTLPNFMSTADGQMEVIPDCWVCGLAGSLERREENVPTGVMGGTPNVIGPSETWMLYLFQFLERLEWNDFKLCCWFVLFIRCGISSRPLETGFHSVSTHPLQIVLNLSSLNVYDGDIFAKTCCVHYQRATAENVEWLHHAFGFWQATKSRGAPPTSIFSTLFLAPTIQKLLQRYICLSQQKAFTELEIICSLFFYHPTAFNTSRTTQPIQLRGNINHFILESVDYV